MTPERLALFLGLVERHANIPPALASEVAAHLREQAARVERLEEVVREHEWIGTDLGNLYCLACESRESYGHTKDCMVLAALTSTP